MVPAAGVAGVLITGTMMAVSMKRGEGSEHMSLLGIRPGREVGEAYRFLLELRLDEGPLGEEAATERLLAWWAARD